MVATLDIYQVFYDNDYGRREYILHWPSCCITGASQEQGHKIRGEGDEVAIIHGYQVFYDADYGRREYILHWPS